MGIHYVNPGLLFNADGSLNGKCEEKTLIMRDAQHEYVFDAM